MGKEERKEGRKEGRKERKKNELATWGQTTTPELHPTSGGRTYSRISWSSGIWDYYT
jgi:hypothetical protein